MRRSTPEVPFSSPQTSQPDQKQRKRLSSRFLLTGGIMLTLLLLAGITFISQRSGLTHAAANKPVATINGLQKIAAVGRTDQIIGANGQIITVDPNPYGLALAPANGANGLKKGDILVSNIGNNDTGNTLVKFVGPGPGAGHLFNVTPSKATMGPADLAFNPTTGSLWVSNETGNDVQVFKPNGTLLTTITNPLFKNPWGMATNGGNVHTHDGATSSFFVSNDGNATIDRIDVIPQATGLPQFKVVQIAQMTPNGAVTKMGLHWLARLKIGSTTLTDVLLAIDPANNRIAAIANSSTTSVGTGSGVTVFAGKPLNVPGGFAINPINQDLLVVNLMDNNLVELNMTLGKVVGVKQIDPVVVDGQGNGSALFGVVATQDNKGNLLVYFTDDNTNTLDVLRAS